MSGQLEVIVVYKKSQLRLYLEKRNAHIQKLIAERDVSVRRLQDAHDAHEATLEEVRRALKKARVPFRQKYRARLRPEDTEGRLLISVGGDGTLLDASHKVRNAPVLGVNSDVGHSVGFLCAADGASFEAVLDDVRAGMLKTEPLLRLHGTVDDVPLPFPVMNGILVSHLNPAATARYILENGDTRDDQKSSGVWLSTPAGSTAAMASAGGVVQMLDDRRLQLRVREPYAADGDGPSLRELLWPGDDEVSIVSRMREGRVYLDGPHECLPLGMGSRLVVHGRGEPLALYVTDEMTKRREETRSRQRARRSSDVADR